MAELCHESYMVCFTYRADIAHSTIKPLAKATVGQMYCAYFDADQQWHRARVIDVMSSTCVSYYYK